MFSVFLGKAHPGPRNCYCFGFFAIFTEFGKRPSGPPQGTGHKKKKEKKLATGGEKGRNVPVEGGFWVRFVGQGGLHVREDIIGLIWFFRGGKTPRTKKPRT